MTNEVVTPELIDRVAPRHGRTSCDDEYPTNGYGGWTGKYDTNTGKRLIKYPRCTRCYLIQHEGGYVKDLEFEVVVETLLVYRGDRS